MMIVLRYRYYVLFSTHIVDYESKNQNENVQSVIKAGMQYSNYQIKQFAASCLPR